MGGRGDVLAQKQEGLSTEGLSEQPGKEEEGEKQAGCSRWTEWPV